MESTPVNPAPTEVTNSAASEICEHCGSPVSNASALEQFLARLGLNDKMIEKLKGSIDSEEVEQYLTTARDYLKSSGEKAKMFTKENPGKVAAGVAVLAVGAGLAISALTRDKS
jgi:hypothetical protein